MIDVEGVIKEIGEDVLHVPKFTGSLWHADAGITASGDGKHPNHAFKTLVEGIAAMSAGDRLIVKAGSYDEHGLDLNLDGMELFCEIGVLITNTNPGTCLTISGNSCTVVGLKVAQTGQIGFAITGDDCLFNHCLAEGCTVAFDIDGDENIFWFCQDDDATVTGFDIANKENVLHLCKSVADGGNSRGFYLSHTDAHKNMLHQCLSIGNGTAGFEVVAGADYNAFASCTSGGGDGARVDAGYRNTWPSFAFENLLHVVQTFAGGGGGSTELFRIYGIVEILFIYGIVNTNLSADVDNISLDIFPDAGVLVALTTLVDSASAVAGSMFIKKSDAGNALVLKSAAVPFISEDDTKQKPFTQTIIGEQGDGTDTHIRCTYSGIATSGAIDWHIEWKPRSNDGFVKVI